MSDLSKYDAPAGAIWVCGACGKTSPNRVQGAGRWDESCFLHAVLCRADSILRGTDGRVVKADAFEVVP